MKKIDSDLKKELDRYSKRSLEKLKIKKDIKYNKRKNSLVNKPYNENYYALIRKRRNKNTFLLKRLKNNHKKRLSFPIKI